MTCSDGSEVELLDIVSIPLLRAVPAGYQSENYLVDVGARWNRVGRAPWTMLLEAADVYDDAFWHDYGNTFHGVRDRVPESETATLKRSLQMISVPRLRIVVSSERQYMSLIPRRKIRAEFIYEGARFRLAVTDPVVEKKCLSQKDRHYQVETAMLCVSVGEPFKGAAYRLVAAVITPRRCEVRT